MNIYAISDLHLSGENVTKPMDVFGGDWEGYIDEIKENWEATVRENDIVLIGGDISWAMRLEDAISDLDFIGRLKGTKILVRGNHDYWWSAISKVRAALPEGVYALQNDSIRFGRAVICGTRGWTVPEAPGAAGEACGPDDMSYKNSAENVKIYNREVGRLEMSLKDASAKREDGDTLICLTHFPPFNECFEESGFTALFDKYKADKVVYGHLHGVKDNYPLYCEKGGVEYYLTSCDKVKNKLVLILSDENG